MSVPALRFDHVSFTYPEGTRPALTDVDLEIAEGTFVLAVGPTGAGKSTLANALLGEPRFDVQEARSDGKGRHTTTRRELVALPGGALLIDTPGLRGVGLWIRDDGIERAFADVEGLIPQCRFSGCSHTNEPACAVRTGRPRP